MKKIFILFFLVLISLIPLFSSADQTKQEVKIYFFYGSTCSSCHKAEPFLNDLEKKYSFLEVVSYEVFNNRDNAKILLDLLEACGEEKAVRVPTIFIGDQVIRGYLNKQTTGQEIQAAVENCLEKKCSDPMNQIQKCDYDTQEKKDEIIDYPIIGKINLSKLSLPVLTFVLAGLDGFNPCAMWVLLFLIALLINLKSRKRIWLVGGTFILVSGIVYYLLLSAWLNFFLLIGYVTITRIIVSFLAIFAGIWQLRTFFKHKPGVCQIAPDGSKIKSKLSEKAKQTAESAALPATFLGVIILAFGVNLVEFFCSAGLPAIYTKILSLSDLSALSYYLYLLFYTIVFMIDDMIVFAIALITLRRIGVTDKYSHWSSLVGGIIILLLGILLLYKPDFLMFS